MTDALLFAGLVPELVPLALEHRRNCLTAGGLVLRFISGRRTWQEQMDNFAKGRARTSGGWVVVDKKLVVTRALPDRSSHCRGAAYDAAPLDELGNIDWDRLDLFRAAAQLAPAGLIWGGSFPNFDGDHWELTAWEHLPLPTSV